MTAPQYSTDGLTYSDLTTAMLAGSYNGMFELVYPQPTALTLAGQPAGAFGLPTAVLRSRRMPASGMLVWLSVFASNELARPFWLDVFNPYIVGLTRVTGTLLRPRWQRAQAARGGALVTYENVEITLLDAVAI